MLREEIFKHLKLRPTGGTSHHAIQALHEFFETMDVDGNGAVGWSELLVTLKSIGVLLSEEEARILTQALDGNGDGYLDMKDFLDFVESNE